MEVRDKFIFETDICPIKNTFELMFDYDLENTFECNVLPKLDSFKYEFSIFCKFLKN